MNPAKKSPAHGWHHGRAVRAELAGVFPLIIYINVRPIVTVKEEVYGVDEQDAQEEADRIKAENTEQRTTAESVVVDDTGNAAVEMAREMGKRQAEGNKAADVVKRFY